ncbi:YjbH domain-containing protein, partial [Gammaproteobacteria bacterium AH-315-E17]|nr:YjbH domain-containing protein [Gammaproteobacteria bacterium AH-315-E17]
MNQMLRPFLVFFIFFIPVTANAADFGTTGLIDIPSARMMNDGEFKIAMSRQTVADIYSLNYQITPWLESTFRYTIFNPDDVTGSGDNLFDRSYEIKLRLIRERRLFPQIAIGIRDVLGTGAWGSEYLVASKAFGPLDLTLGAGWG